MISAIAIDDEPKALKIIENHASKVSYLELKEVFTDPFKALDFINEQKVDLVFLDINMPDLSGLELSRLICNKERFIIFTTAHSEYAIESYEIEAVDYLLKPFDFPRFHSAVSKVNQRLRSSGLPNGDFFFVNSGGSSSKLRYSDIQFIEGSGNYVTYFLEDKKIMVRSTIKQVVARLPTSDFVQIQRSYIVSLAHIDKIQDNHVHIKQRKISIGPSFKEQFKSIIEVFSYR